MKNVVGYQLAHALPHTLPTLRPQLPFARTVRMIDRSMVLDRTHPPKSLSVVIPIVAGVGNALMAVPMVRQLKRGNVGRVTIVARISAMAEPFRRMPEVDEVIVTGAGSKNLIDGIRATRRRRADVYLIPFPSNRWQYSLLAMASGARRKVLNSYPIGHFRTFAFLVGERLPAIKGVHDVEQNLHLLRKLNIEPDLTDAPNFILRSEDGSAARELLQGVGLGDGEPFIAVHAGSAKTILAKAKRWPAVRYARLVETMSREFGLPIVLFEGPDEAGVADEILSLLGTADAPARSAKILAVNGPLGNAAAVLERATLYVGSDSGLAHLAASVRTPPVTIFAPADPDRVCPLGYRHLVVQPPCGCCPCFEYPWTSPFPRMKCREPLCVTRVTVDSVMTAVRVAMAAKVSA